VGSGSVGPWLEWGSPFHWATGFFWPGVHSPTVSFYPSGWAGDRDFEDWSYLPGPHYHMSPGPRPSQKRCRLLVESVD
jgi:hypothetical protein